MPIVTDYTALISGSSWAGIELSGRPTIVTYSFPTAAPGYDSGITEIAGVLGTFQAFDAAQQTMARAALAEWSAASGLVFLEVAPGLGDLAFQRIDFTGTVFQPYAGIGYYPFGSWDNFSYPYLTSSLDSSGDVFMNTAVGPMNYSVLLHEVGHAIGMKHPTEIFGTHDQVLAADDSSLTIMAQTGVASAHLQQLDKDAAAFLYGAAGTGGVYTGNAAGANSLVSWNWNAGIARLTQYGAGGDDAIRGTSVNDVIYGYDGNDKLFGLAGDDSLFGGNGNDLLFGGQGVNKLYGGAGDDEYFLMAADAVYESVGGGYDRVYSSVSVTLATNAEYLQLFGSGLTGRGNTGDNTMFGDAIAGTTLLGKAGDDYIGGGGGVDRLYGEAGIDTIFAGAGNDYIDGGSENDFLYGEAGNDTFNWGTGADLYDGGADTDAVTFASAGAIQVYLDGSGVNGGAALGDVFVDIENIYGGAQADTIVGNGQTNKLLGNGGNDTLTGLGGNDTLYGGAANDRLSGGLGTDVLYGEAGIDTFVFDTGPGGASGADKIMDFVHLTDKIEIDASVFGGGLVAGGVAQLVANATPSSAGFFGGVFLYDTDNGYLSFDADGQGAGAAVLFARLVNLPTLTSADFVFVA